MRRLLANSPSVYTAVLVSVMLAAYPFKLRTKGAFACSAEGYRADVYMGYCDASAYGDYDHGAVWFGLEPGVQEHASDADVLFLGSSRMQFAFSTQATDQWFDAHAASHYLLGFTHTENQTFAGPLLERLQPRARVYVINAEQFFSSAETGPGSEVLHDPEIEKRYLAKRAWQPKHRVVCTELAWLCGDRFAYYRAVETGHFFQAGINGARASSAAMRTDTSLETQRHYAEVAERFVAKLPVGRGCVLLTLVPGPATPSDEAQAIADMVGIELIAPWMEDLRLYDGSHLDGPSAERWSRAFFELAGPRIQQCLPPS
jgi:hypothetical protein